MSCEVWLMLTSVHSTMQFKKLMNSMDPFEDIFSPEPVDMTTLCSSSPSAEETTDPQIRQAGESCGDITERRVRTVG